jgi:hypothetical protein
MSVPENGGKLQDLIAMADGINHAIPTHQELQRSLGWLKHRGLVAKDGRTFSLTPGGAELLARCRKHNHTMMKVWNAVTLELGTSVGTEAPLDDITIDEEARAYEAHKKDFWSKFRKLEESDT